MIILITGQRADTTLYVDDSNHAYTTSKRRNGTWYMKCKKCKCHGRSVMEVVDNDFLNADMVNTKPHDHPPQRNIIESVESVRRRIKEPGFEEELIQEVRNRPTIWDRKSKYYNNRTLHDHEWDQVAAALGCPKETCKAKWRNMRDVFMKEIKKDASKWAYYEHLMFLKDVAVCTTRVKEEPSDDDDRRDDLTSDASTAGSHFMDISESLRAQSPAVLEARTWADQTILPRTDVTSTDRCDEPSRKRKAPTPDYHRQPTSVRYAEEEEVRSESEDEDKLFLRSLAPYFKHLPPVQKLRLRSKIENLIADEIGNYAS